MANKVLSVQVKAQKQLTLNEKKMKDAVNAYCLKQGKPKHLRKGVHTIAKEFGIESQWRTISNHYNGGRSV